MRRSTARSRSTRAPVTRIARRAVGLIAALALALGAVSALSAPSALADGDPGSDVLVYQPVFLAADAGISVHEQVKLGDLLHAAAGRGFAIRVAIIATRSDLGAVTGLWREPRAYAHFLGLELSLTYKGRLLVVMPNGFGFSWPGHSSAAAYRTLRSIQIRPGGPGLAAATQTGVRSLGGRGRNQARLRRARHRSRQSLNPPVRRARRPARTGPATKTS